jgi:hypothetical protein
MLPIDAAGDRLRHQLARRSTVTVSLRWTAKPSSV